jgi:GT2 family glycosyltransferase
VPREDGSDEQERYLVTDAIPTDTIAVVICAYTLDRWDDTIAAVQSVRCQTTAAKEIVVVVDYNVDLLDRLRSALPDVTVVENRYQKGLSGGKDTGVEATASDIVAFLDDDAVAHQDWLGHLRSAYTDDDIVGVGGTTLPRWTTDRPRWFPEEFDWVLGCTFTGREPGPVRNLLGGNASFRRDVFSVAGGFPSHIGRTSAQSRPLGCEETEFCIRVNQHRPNWRYVFEPRAVIWHRVGAERERFAYFRTRCFAEGLSKAAVTRSVGVADGLSVERSYTTRTLRRGVVRGFGEALRGDRGGMERSLAISMGLLAAAAGYARGDVAARRKRSTSPTSVPKVPQPAM